jgi:hypothetical protein
MPALGGSTPQPQMRPCDVNYDVIQLQVSDLRDAQAAAARQADDHKVALDIRRASGARRQVGKDGS